MPQLPERGTVRVNATTSAMVLYRLRLGEIHEMINQCAWCGAIKHDGEYVRSSVRLPLLTNIAMTDEECMK